MYLSERTISILDFVRYVVYIDLLTPRYVNAVSRPALAHLEMLEHVLMHALRALVSRRRIHSEHANYERKRFKRAICE